MCGLGIRLQSPPGVPTNHYLAVLHAGSHAAFLFAHLSCSMFVRPNGHPGLVTQHRNTVAFLGSSHRPPHELLPDDLLPELAALWIGDGRPAPCDGLKRIDFEFSNFRQVENSVQVALDSLCEGFMTVLDPRGF